MKNIFLLFIAILFLQFTSLAQQGWFWQNPLPQGNPLYGVSFTDANNGTAVGWDGAILRKTNGGVSFVEEKDIDEIPKAYFLSNNYPNPFNPNTRIKYSVSQSSQVIIKVFDILGNEIETLVNEQKPIGTYEIT